MKFILKYYFLKLNNAIEFFRQGCAVMSSTLKFFFCVFSLHALINTSIAQTILYESKFNGRLDNFYAVPLGDSILFSFDENGVKRTTWIVDSLQIRDSITIDIISSLNFNGEVYLYHLKQNKISKQLKALVANTNKKNRVESASEVALEGTILGIYQDNNLHLVMLDDKGIEITIIEINKLDVVSKKTFKLPINVLQYITSAPADFYTTESEVNRFIGTSKLKLFKYKQYKELYITVDETEVQLPATWVIKLNLETGDVISSKIPADNEKNEFSSFMLDEKLFRTSIGKKQFGVSVFDVNTNERIASSVLPPEQTDFKVYFRYGRKNVIHKRETFSRMIKGSYHHTPMVNVIKQDAKYIIQWGTYYNEKGFFPYGGSEFPLLGVATMIIGSVIIQSMDGPGINQYFYYEWNTQNNTFNIRDTPDRMTREKIDQYEIDLRRRPRYKNYIAYKDGVAAIYYDAKLKAISVVYFK